MNLRATMSAITAVLLVSLLGCASQRTFLSVIESESEPSECPSVPIFRGKDTYDLALSGGGYRAMLFHVGALWRLHELGILRDTRVISSVSGGSIAAGVLALQLERIQSDLLNNNTNCFRKFVADPLVAFVQTTVDVKAASRALVSPSSAGNALASYYRTSLFGDARLQDIPIQPAFAFQATNLHTGSVWSFTRDWMGDPQVGYTVARDVRLSDAVAASSSFPPFLSPFVLNNSGRRWLSAPSDTPVVFSREYVDKRRSSRIDGNFAAVARPEVLDEMRQRTLLTDGGVADNLAIEGIWFSTKTLLISDGGANPTAVLHPSSNWLAQLAQITELIHGQPSQLRYRDMLEGFRTARRTGGRDGAYWALGKPLPCHAEQKWAFSSRANDKLIARLSSIQTRLAAMDRKQAHELVNLGYHMADWSIPYIDARWRKVTPEISNLLPYPNAPIWEENRTQGGIGYCGISKESMLNLRPG